MSEHLLTPHDVAGVLNIPMSTLELWCAVFGSALSVSARSPDVLGAHPNERRFTQKDVVVLAGAKQLLARQVTSTPAHGSPAH